MARREGFMAIADGWMLVNDFDELTDRIERLGAWTKENGPLSEDEAATVTMMIECQVAQGMARGDFEEMVDSEWPPMLGQIKRMQRAYASMYGKPADGLFVPACRADELLGLAQVMAAHQGNLACDEAGNLPAGLVIDTVMGMRVRLCTGDVLGVGAAKAEDDTPAHWAIWLGKFNG